MIDFYCAELKLAVELDGDVHNLPENNDNDLKRQERLEDFGIHFVRIKNDELMGNANKAFERIENEIKSLRNPSFIKGAEI